MNRAKPASLVTEVKSILKRTLALILSTLILIPLVAFPQQRRGRQTKNRPRAAATPKPTPPDHREEAAALSEQLKIISRFLYLYGRISNGLETAEAQEKRGELSRTLSDKNKQNRTRVAENINGLKAGLEQLSAKFQNKPGLLSPSLKIQSSTEDIAAASQMAEAGQFDEAGRTLVKVAERLAEALAEIR